MGLLHSLGIGIEYIVAVVLIVAGLYLAMKFSIVATSPLFPFLVTIQRLGIGLALFGFGLALVTYGKSIGGAECEAHWKKANYEAQIAELKKEAEAKQAAVEDANKAAKQLEQANDGLQKEISDYQTSVNALNAATETCRRATADDDKRVQRLTGATAKGHRAPGNGRKAR